jgi:YaaC-like Protein
MPAPWKSLPIPISDEELAVWSRLLSPLQVTGNLPTIFFSSPGRPLSADRICMFFESTGNLKSLLRKAANFEAGPTQLLHISACLRQGREFFQDARVGEGMTRPISLFYGMASFAKAVVLSYGRPRTLDKLSPTHGLEAPNRYDKELEDLVVEVRSRGTRDVLFHNFVDAMSANSRVPAEARRRASAPAPDVLPTSSFWIWVPSAHAEELQNSRFSLSELLSVIPGLEDLFEYTFNRPPALIEARLRFGLVPPTEETPVASLVVSNPHRLAVEALYQRVPHLMKWRLFTTGEDWLIFENLPPELEPRPSLASEQMANLTPLAEILPPFLGDKTLAGALNNHWLHEAVSLYLAAFLLSSVARYRPDIWIGLATFDPKASQVKMKAVIEAFFEIALERFPLHCLGAIASTAFI